MAFTENDIRPVAFDAGKREALERDLDWLRARRAGFVEVDCPACDGKDRGPAFEKFGFSFQRCAACGTAYMSPRATPELLGAFYTDSALYAFWNAHIFPASREARRANIFRPRAERLAEICRRERIDGGMLVEVGAANGIFCEEAKRTGCFRRVVAIEPGQALAETCRALGIETIARPFEAVESLDAPADVIASFETIEHVFSPADFLARCRRLLRPGGLVVLTCPNYEGFDIQALGAASDSLDAEHINMMNPEALTQLASRSGFEVVECTTPGALDAELVRNKALSGDIDLNAQPFLRTVLIERWDELGPAFQRFLQENRLSSHMWLVGRRANQPE
jgi:2-polyprenyl-3-methyl-5-hydroxy-6-metoxy-1,4-benzoquinol methylase